MTKFLFAALCFGMAVGACRRAEPKLSVPVVFDPAAAQSALSAGAAEPDLVWRKLGAWSGHGSTQTEPFISDTGSLRVRWQTRGETAAGRGRFRVVVHSDVSGRSLGVAVDASGVGRDTVYFSEDPRPFFLAVESENIEWTLAVEEPLPTTSTSSAPR